MCWLQKALWSLCFTSDICAACPLNTSGSSTRSWFCGTYTINDLKNILAITMCLLPSKPWSNASMEAAGVLMTSLHLRGRPCPHSRHFRNDRAQELAQSLTSKGVMANRSGANHQRKHLPAVATNSCQLFLSAPFSNSLLLMDWQTMDRQQHLLQQVSSLVLPWDHILLGIWRPSSGRQLGKSHLKQ